MKDSGCSDADKRNVLDSADFSREHIAQCAKSGHFVVIEAGAPKFPSVELNAMINRFNDSTRQTPALNDDRQLCLSSSMGAAAPLLMIHVVETMLVNGIPKGKRDSRRVTTPSRNVQAQVRVCDPSCQCDKQTRVTRQPGSYRFVLLISTDALVLTEPINSETIVREHLVVWSAAGERLVHRKTHK